MAEQGTQQGGLTDPLSVRNTDTGSMKRLAAEQQGAQARKTIKLKPLSPKKEVNPSDLTTSAPAFQTISNTSNEATVSMERDEVDQTTQKLQKPSMQTSASPAPQQSSQGLPGVKQTIKLRPSTSGQSEEPQSARPASAQTIKLTPKSSAEAAPGSAEDEKTVAMAKQTIKLVPKKGEVTSTAPTMPKPSDPTINLQSSGLKPSDPTVKLSPTQISQAPAGAADETVEGGAVQETKPRIGLKHTGGQPAAQSPSVAAASAAMEESVESAEAGDVKDEPSIIFTIAAVLAFLLIAYGALAMFGQYSNQWMGGNMDVPGLSRLK